MRAAIFIDGAYLEMYAKRKKITLDYKGLANYLMAPLRKQSQVDLMRCYFYDCPPWVSHQQPTQDEMRRMQVHEEFKTLLNSLDRWHMSLGKLQKRWDKDKEYFEQKRVDVLLSCDLVRHAAAGHIQHAILVAGDSDFIPAVAAAKESGVTLTLWHNQLKSVHDDLLSLADEVHMIDFKKIRMVKKSTKKTSRKASKKVSKKRS